jgi:hypothetical protein
MGDYKGSSIVLLNKLLADRGPQAKQTFLDSLTVEERRCFNSVAPSSWVPIPLAEGVMSKAVAVLYPNDPQGFFKLGESRAQYTLQGLYSMIFNVLSTEAIVDASYRLWPMLHNRGVASVERKPGSKEATFSISGYPDLPKSFRLMLEGFFFGCFKIGKARNLQMQRIEDDPNLWKWKGTWE